MKYLKPSLISCVTLLLLFTLWGCSAFGNMPEDEHLERIKLSPHFKKATERFENKRQAWMENFRDSIGVFGAMSALWNSHPLTSPDSLLPTIKPDITEFLKPSSSIKFIWLGHSSFLVNMEQTILLFDPVFSENASPFFFGASRFQDPVLKLEELPKIDWVIISHDHYDHLDLETIEFLRDHQPQIRYATPLGVSSHLHSWDISKSNTYELDWWQDIQIADSLRLHCTPSQHFSGRVSPFSNQTLWSSWVVASNSAKIFYSGDTGYDTHFKDIAEKFGTFDVAFMENGQYNPKWEPVHLLPHQTIKAFEEIHAKHMVSVHWGMYSLSPHAWYEPVERTTSLSAKKGLSQITPLVGELVKLNDSLPKTKWWKPFVIEK